MTPGLRRPTGFGALPLARLEFYRDAEVAVRRGDLLDQRGERQAGEMRLAFGRQAGQLLQDLAAALALRAQQLHVLGMGRVGAERALHLAGYQRYRRERRAEFVSGGGSQPVERGEMLLALQHEFGRRQRIGEEPRFLGDAEGVDAGEGYRRRQRYPGACDIDEGHASSAPSYQGSGRWKKGEQRRHRDDHAAEQRRHR